MNVLITACIISLTCISFCNEIVYQIRVVSHCSKNSNKRYDIINNGYCEYNLVKLIIGVLMFITLFIFGINYVRLINNDEKNDDDNENNENNESDENSKDNIIENNENSEGNGNVGASQYNKPYILDSVKITQVPTNSDTIDNNTTNKEKFL